MEVGGDEYARGFGGAIERVDVLHATADNEQATIVGDLATGAGLQEGVLRLRDLHSDAELDLRHPRRGPDA